MARKGRSPLFARLAQKSLLVDAHAQSQHVYTLFDRAFEVLERQERTRAVPTNEEIVAAIDPIIAFVRAGLQALPAPAV